MACCVILAGMMALASAAWRRCCRRAKPDAGQALRWRLEIKDGT